MWGSWSQCASIFVQRKPGMKPSFPVIRTASPPLHGVLLDRLLIQLNRKNFHLSTMQSKSSRASFPVIIALAPQCLTALSLYFPDFHTSIVTLYSRSLASISPRSTVFSFPLVYSELVYSQSESLRSLLKACLM